ncbi:hypothetical protein [Actinomadura mexicana]|uniref:Uncharacterized protein n=1 Tax=Actinomadura mexicana TaxID=134959 RepID=A0A238Z8P5_9ACTN|nr:hypothetical protein [Actinomadura mexicana]SNR79449.1 hypothetical protein SAMN06265355_10734 [Actinomadura mexicana]
MATPDDLERQFTLLTAVSHYEALRTRDALTAPDDHDDGATDAVPLTRAETLEMLALGEVIARKAGYGRQLSVRSARRAGASWAQIGAALGTSKQAAWETHNRWIDEQARRQDDPGHWGWDDTDVTIARALAGEPDDKEEI